MNIKIILETAEHNPHYLNRYIKFIEYCKNSTNKNKSYEKHHICPSSLFPEYKKLKDNPWNMIKLTPRQHYIAHWILAKTFNGKMWYALFMMSMGNKNSFMDRDYLISSKQYEYCKDKLKGIKRSEEHKKLLAESKKNHTVYKDQDGNKFWLHKDDPLIEEKGLVGHTKGSSRKGVNKGIVTCINLKTNEKIKVSKKEFDNNDHYVGVNHNKADWSKGRKWMKSPSGKYKVIKQNEVEHYLKLGYIFDNVHKGKIGESKGTIWMNNDIENVRCLPEEEEKYKDRGYKRGRIKGFKWKKNKGE